MLPTPTPMRRLHPTGRWQSHARSRAALVVPFTPVRLSLQLLCLRGFRAVARCARPKLRLCFDVNKTVVMEDSAGKKSARQLCNEAIADACWGRELGGVWTWSGAPLGLEPPGEELLTYSAWVNDRFPDVVSTDPSNRDAARAASRKAKKTRDALRGSFAERVAPPQVSALLEPMLQGLVIPETLLAQTEALEAAGLAQRRSWFLLPSFLSAIRRLLEAQHASDASPEISLEFRSFLSS